MINYSYLCLSKSNISMSLIGSRLNFICCEWVRANDYTHMHSIINGYVSTLI